MIVWIHSPFHFANILKSSCMNYSRTKRSVWMMGITQPISHCTYECCSSPFSFQHPLSQPSCFSFAFQQHQYIILLNGSLWINSYLDGTTYLDISNDWTRLIFNEFHSDLSNTTSRSRSTKDFCYFCEFNRLSVHCGHWVYGSFRRKIDLNLDQPLIVNKNASHKNSPSPI